MITCKTPVGRPTSASSIALAHASSDRGVQDAGLAITVQPAARAGAIERIASCRGKFHGTICAVTPRGCLKV